MARVTEHVMEYFDFHYLEVKNENVPDPNGIAFAYPEVISRKLLVVAAGRSRKRAE
jgi:hypothetical protein